MASITSANAVFSLTVKDAGIAANLQGFSADDIFDTEQVEAGEAVIGVDGNLSTGFVYALIKQSISLQADSPSIVLFENWYGQERAAVDKYLASATVTLKSINRRFILTNGTLLTYSAMPDAKKLLSPRKFGLAWQSVLPAPM